MERFAGERGVEYDLFRDEFAELADAIGATAMPITLFVTSDGTIVEQTGAARRRRTPRRDRRPARRRRGRRMSLSFIRGMVAAVNPCGFILLPTYLMYFLGLQGAMPGTQRATMRRAVIVSAAVSAGFLSVFLVAGVISYNFTSWINENAKYATGAIGVALLVLGAAMLVGYKLPFMTPRLDAGGSGGPKQTVSAMFVYGIAYAVASIGCTIGLFIATVFSSTSRDGIVSGVGNMLAYGAGMALLVSALTIALASANTGLLKVLRGSLQYVDRIAAFFVLLSGCYLLWYFYWVDVREEGDPITDWALERQAQATVFLTDHWQVVGLVMLAVVGAAMAYAWSRPNAAIDAQTSATRRRTVVGRNRLTHRVGRVAEWRRGARLQVVDRPGLRGQFVAMVGVGDRDQRPGALADRAATEFGDTPLGDDLVDGVLRGGHHVACRELRHDA